MTTALAWTTVALGGLGGLVAVMTLVGWTLPRRHVAARTLGLPVTPAVAWQTLADFPGQMTWRRGLAAVDRLPDPGEGEVWRERHGRHVVAFRTAEATPPSRLVRRVADEQGPFRGTWEFAGQPAAGPATCRVTLTERGEVANPFLRFVNRFVIGQATTLEGYLRDLAAKFGADPTLDAG